MFHCSATSGTPTLRTNNIAGRMLLRYLSLIVPRFASPFSRLSRNFLRGKGALLGSCYLTGSLQLSSGVISAHCTRPNQNNLSSVEISRWAKLSSSSKSLVQAIRPFTLWLVRVVWFALTFGHSSWALRVSIAATLVKPVRGLSRRSSFLTCDLPQTAHPSLHLLAAFAHQNTSVAVAFHRLCSRLRKLQAFALLAISHYNPHPPSRNGSGPTLYNHPSLHSTCSTTLPIVFAPPNTVSLKSKLLGSQRYCSAHNTEANSGRLDLKIAGAQEPRQS